MAKKLKGIILAGGSGTRLYPVTLPICKQLLPVYDKPMIYYPLSTLMLAGIQEVLIISTPQDTPRFEQLFGDGAHLGLKMSYQVQERPEGLAQAFILGKDFIGDDNVCLILGDNLFYGNSLGQILKSAKQNIETHGGANVFGYWVQNPKDYGVVAFDSSGQVTSIEEKPAQPKSNFAVVGLYFYDNSVVKVAQQVKPSARGELEITSVNQWYLSEQKLAIEVFGRGMAWLDTGTHSHLLEAAQFVQILEKRTGLKIGCIEEIAFRNGWIDHGQLMFLAEPLLKTEYGQYLKQISN